jgi:ribosome-interacting GTPase 1
VDLPPLCREHVEPWVYDLVRAADLAWLVVSTAEMLAGIDTTAELLATRGLELCPAGADAPEATRPGWTRKPALLVITGLDRPGAAQDVDTLRELLDRPWPVVPVSTVTRAGLGDLARRTFDALGVMRIYTKTPGRDADRVRPFTLPVGATVADLARVIHNDIAARLKFARIWGHGAFAGQAVGDTHVLGDGDVVEIHM